MLKRISFNQVILVLLILSAIGTLSAVFIFEYLGVKPCILCLYQRIPYFVGGILGLLGLFLSAKYARFLVLLAALRKFHWQGQSLLKLPPALREYFSPLSQF